MRDLEVHLASDQELWPAVTASLAGTEGWARLGRHEIADSRRPLGREGRSSGRTAQPRSHSRVRDPASHRPGQALPGGGSEDELSLIRARQARARADDRGRLTGLSHKLRRVLARARPEAWRYSPADLTWQASS
jgi:hypothetical protein